MGIAGDFHAWYVLTQARQENLHGSIQAPTQPYTNTHSGVNSPSLIHGTSAQVIVQCCEMENSDSSV